MPIWHVAFSNTERRIESGTDGWPDAVTSFLRPFWRHEVEDLLATDLAKIKNQPGQLVDR
jgi:hypothetical protein